MTGLETGAILAIAGTAVSVVGSVAQGIAQSRAANANAQVNENNAIQATAQAAETERRVRRDNMLRLGQTSANRGASGVAVEGSPLDVFEDSAAELELSALDERYRGLVQSDFFRRSAALDRQQGSQALRGGIFSAAGTLLGAGFEHGGSLLKGSGSFRPPGPFGPIGSSSGFS